MILVLFSITAIALLFLQNSKVQNYITQYAASRISEKLNAKITLEKASFSFINRIQLKNLYIEDQHGDTLLYVEKMVGVLSGFNFSKKNFIINRFILEHANINFIADTSGVLNFNFIISELIKSNKKDSTQSNFRINKIDINNSEFHYRRLGKVNETDGINYADMDMFDLNFKLGNFTIIKDTVSFKVNDLSLREKSGLEIYKLNTGLKISKRVMYFDNLFLKTQYTSLNADYVHLNFNSFSDFSDFVHLIDIEADLKSSSVSFRDISYFSPTLRNFNEEFIMAGIISGQINNLRGENISLSYKNNTQLDCNFTMIGLPQIASTFLNLDILDLHSTIPDLKMLKIPVKNNIVYLKIPAFMDNLGEIKYSGKFTGYPDDFVAYGNFTTSLGKLSTDILLQPDTANRVAFRGKMKSNNFDFGSMFKTDVPIGKISINANINGFITGKSVNANLDGLIDSIKLYNYSYKNIQLSGTLSDKKFNGSFNVKDPNIEMEFSGMVDLKSENPEFAFTADVIRARPYFLNVPNSEPDFFVSFLLKTNFTGKSIDDLKGEIKLVNSLFRKKDKQIQIYNFNLQAGYIENTKNITIRSDVIDGNINGNYQFSSIVKSFQNLVFHYIPALEKDNTTNQLFNDENNFVFDFQLKNNQLFTDFFFPDYGLAENTNIHGKYNPQEKQIELTASCPLFIFHENEWKNLIITGKSNEESVTITSTSENLNLKNDITLENLNFKAELSSDTTNLKFDWNSYLSPRYEGKIDLTTVFSRNSVTNNPIVKILINPSEIFFNDTLWNISKTNILIDSSSIDIDSLNVHRNNQKFMVYGKVSKDPEDKLHVNFNELDISMINIFTKKSRFVINGKVSGVASLSDPFNKPIFLSDLHLENLKINDEVLGNGEILANWNHDDKKIHIKTSAGSGSIPTFNIEGNYSPKTRELDFKIALDKLRVNIFQKFTDFLISDLKGLATGELTLKGTTKTPDFNGTIKLMKTSFKVNYLKTKYNFTNDIVIDHNNIVLKDFKIYDENGNQTTGEGVISNKYFKNFNFALKAETQNFEFLNSSEGDNPLFYGHIFASGIIMLNGPPNELMMDIVARSQRNSVLVIPLYGADEIRESNFIYWKSNSENEISNLAPEKFQINVKGLQMNFELEVTPDAEVQLVFDPKIGDIIRGNGNGSLNIFINTKGKFEIFGDIIIEEGDYLFTLKNLINKRFTIEKGGRISWNGDPIDANVDIQAFYNLRTSLYPLDPSNPSLKKRIPVACKINMTGKLMNPTIVTEITLPSADQQSQNILKSNINTQEELTKQFMSLLILNEFFSSSQGIGGQGGTAISGTNTVGVAGLELFSNQFSHWVSQISREFDLGVNYRPADEITKDELELAMSTQILNDRVSISGNIDIGGNEIRPTTKTTTNNIVGDFTIDITITEKLHVKGFNRSNDNFIFQTSSPYTQGFGFFYRESFNNAKELFSRYDKGFKKLFRSAKKDLKKQ